MTKSIRELVWLVGAFFCTWLLLSQINFIELFHVRQITRDNEMKLGRLTWDFFRSNDDEITDSVVIAVLDSIKYRICIQNGIQADSIKIHVLRHSEVNAFSLPANYLVFYSALLDSCRSADEISGVMAHEIAHMEKKHVIRKLAKEFGLTVLVTATGGGRSAETIKEAAKLFSSSLYDRALETEADTAAVRYLITAGLDPSGLVSFMTRLADSQKDLPKGMFWISSHPEAIDRANLMQQVIRKYRSDAAKVCQPDEWKAFREHLHEH